MNTFVVAAEAAQWSSAAWLAGVSAATVGGVKLIDTYSGEAGPGGARGVIRERLSWLLALLALEAAAGIATAGLVVLLGVSEPAWIDKPLGWLLVGIVGPTVAAATIAKFTIGDATEINVGLSLVYLPLRRRFIRPIDDAFLTAGREFEGRAQEIYLQRARDAFRKGTLSLESLISRLEEFAGREIRKDDEKEEIDKQLELARQSPAGGTEEELGEVLRLVAFVVAQRYFAVIDDVLGKLGSEDLAGVASPKPPAGVVT